MPDKPTTRQLSYLRSLANRTGQTFTYPTTVAEDAISSFPIVAVHAFSRSGRLSVIVSTRSCNSARICSNSILVASFRSGEAILAQPTPCSPDKANPLSPRAGAARVILTHLPLRTMYGRR
jgi:hypothetical protein